MRIIALGTGTDVGSQRDKETQGMEVLCTRSPVLSD